MPRFPFLFFLDAVKYREYLSALPEVAVRRRAASEEKVPCHRSALTRIHGVLPDPPGRLANLASRPSSAVLSLVDRREVMRIPEN